jgi:hypothetical protein
VGVAAEPSGWFMVIPPAACPAEGKLRQPLINKISY